MAESGSVPTYVMAGNQKFQAAIASRSVAGPFASFFLPYLEPGLSLLDCGCGPGSITMGLAQVVAPGRVVGTDIDESAIGAARLNSLSSDATNLSFEVADAYELPFEDESFDRVFVSSLLEHLKEPVRAVREIIRVLKPGGIAGIGGTAGVSYIYPRTPVIDELLQISNRVLMHWGGDPNIGQRLREVLLEGGFERADAGASGLSNGTDAETRRAAEGLIARSFSGRVFATMREQGWIDESRIEEMKQAIQDWGSHPHAVAVTMYGTAVGFKA